MKPTRHATTNYRMMRELIDRMDGDHRRFTSSGFMPLVLERLYNSSRGTVYSLTHYGEQNGDAMRDPDMEIAINEENGTAEPLTFRNDYMGTFQEVYITRGGKELYSPGLRSSLDDFLWHWLRNIRAQGFLNT